MNTSEISRGTAAISFRWSYIAAPAVILLATLILTAVLFPRLSAEVGYHFKSDGSPDRFMGRGQIMFILLLPQIVLAAISAGTTLGMIMFSSRFHQILAVKLSPMALLMGNIVALPQLVLFLFTLEVFLYDVYSIRLLPIWALGAIVMIGGVIILSFFFTKTLREARRTTK